MRTFWLIDLRVCEESDYANGEGVAVEGRNMVEAAQAWASGTDAFEELDGSCFDVMVAEDARGAGRRRVRITQHVEVRIGATLH